MGSDVSRPKTVDELYFEDFAGFLRILRVFSDFIDRRHETSKTVQKKRFLCSEDSLACCFSAQQIIRR